jgi:hypothetical protein
MSRYRASEHEPRKCPVCFGAANTEKSGALACCWCGWRSVLEQGEWRTVGACLLFNGDWPAHDGHTGSST